MKENGDLLVLFMTTDDLYSNDGDLEGIKQRDIFLLNEYEENLCLEERRKLASEPQ